MTDREALIRAGRDVIARTGKALAALGGRLDGSFAEAVLALAACEGRVVVTGLGKSGHVGRKLASTFSGTGTPAAFIHATEATHGDLGFLRGEDCCILISKSGENEELHSWMPFLRERGCRTLAITGNPDSYLGREADITLDASVDEEACPNNLAPTTSSTAALVTGDALAVALLGLRDFGPEDFLRLHPGGILGRRLSLRVRDLMAQGEDLPRVSPDTPLRQALLAIIEGGLGVVCLEDAEGRLAGLLTDGDLKRLLVREDPESLLDQPVSRFATADPRGVEPERLATEALTLMETNQPGAITGLAVTDARGRLLGYLHIHAILQAGLG